MGKKMDRFEEGCCSPFGIQAVIATLTRLHMKVTVAWLSKKQISFVIHSIASTLFFYSAIRWLALLSFNYWTINPFAFINMKSPFVLLGWQSN